MLIVGSVYPGGLIVSGAILFFFSLLNSPRKISGLPIQYYTQRLTIRAMPPPYQGCDYYSTFPAVFTAGFVPTWFL